jgi:hypothetical protein
VPAAAPAQSRWTIDAKSSLAWWQVNPHLNHLWATTCPEEPSWRPGEGRSGGWVIDRAFRPPKQGYAAVSDTTLVPLYPRPRVRSVCTEAMSGQILVTDTASLRGVRGQIVVRADALVGGEDRRDAYARQAILETTRYPEIKFRIDSIIDVTRRGDTIVGTVVGVFTLRDVSKPMTASMRALPTPAGLRVLAKFRIPAEDLVPEYGISKFALGLGVGARVWIDLFMGVDAVVRPEGS